MVSHLLASRMIPRLLCPAKETKFSRLWKAMKANGSGTAVLFYPVLTCYGKNIRFLLWHVENNHIVPMKSRLTANKEARGVDSRETLPIYTYVRHCISFPHVIRHAFHRALSRKTNSNFRNNKNQRKKHGMRKEDRVPKTEFKISTDKSGSHQSGICIQPSAWFSLRFSHSAWFSLIQPEIQPDSAWFSLIQPDIQPDSAWFSLRFSRRFSHSARDSARHSAWDSAWFLLVCHHLIQMMTLSQNDDIHHFLTQLNFRNEDEDAELFFAFWSTSKTNFVISFFPDVFVSWTGIFCTKTNQGDSLTDERPAHTHTYN